MVLGMNPPPLPPKFGTFEYSAIPVVPASPALSSPRTGSFHSTHFRRRSSFSIDNDVTIQLESTTLDSTSFPSEKRYGGTYSTEKSGGEAEPFSVVGTGSSKGYIAWKDGRSASRRAGVKRCIAFFALLMVCVLGWLGGLATNEVSTRQDQAAANSVMAGELAPAKK